MKWLKLLRYASVLADAAADIETYAVKIIDVDEKIRAADYAGVPLTITLSTADLRVAKNLTGHLAKLARKSQR